MEKSFSVTVSNQLFILKDLASDALIIFLLYLLYLRIGDPDVIPLLGKGLVVAYLLFEILPCSVVHVQYLVYNLNRKLVVDRLTKTITIQDKTLATLIHIDDILKVSIVRAPTWLRGELRGLSATDRYRYAVIELMDHRKFVITCLLVFDLRKFFGELGIISTEQRVIVPLVVMARHKPKRPGWVV